MKGTTLILFIDSNKETLITDLESLESTNTLHYCKKVESLLLSDAMQKVEATVSRWSSPKSSCKIDNHVNQTKQS